MSYEYDKRLLRSAGRRGYGGFGEVSASDLQPWHYILAPKTILSKDRYGYNGNQNVDTTRYFPRSFFTVPVIKGGYKIAVMDAWLRSIGADPAKARIVTEDGTVGIDGTKVGLCFWPPTEFYNQQHLNAWLAYWKTFRRYLDRITALGFNERLSSCMTVFETADMVGGARPDLFANNAIAVLRRQTIDLWGSIPDDEDATHESTMWGTPDSSAVQYEFNIPTLDKRDPEVHAKILTLYLFGCMHMAYWVSTGYVAEGGKIILPLPGVGTCPQLPEHPAFPGVAQLPYLNEYTPDIGGMFSSVFVNAAIGLVTGGVTKAAMGMGTSFAQLAAVETRKSSFAGLAAPSNPMWTSYIVPITEFVDWPQAPAVPLTPAQRILQSGVDLTITTPATQAIPRTLAQRILDSGVDLTITTPMTIKPGTRGYIEVVKAKQQSSLLLPALGIGGALLLMKLLKKKG